MAKEMEISLNSDVLIVCKFCETKFIPKRGEYSIKEEDETYTGEVWVKHFILGFECPVCKKETEMGYWGGVKK